MTSPSIRAKCSGTFSKARTPPNPALNELTTTRPIFGSSATCRSWRADRAASSNRGNNAGSEKGSA